MKRNATLLFTMVLALLLLMTFAGINHFSHHSSDLPFRCSAFSRYDLSRNEGERLDFNVSQDLRFTSPYSGYLLLNGQVSTENSVTILNRRIVLGTGNKIDNDTYRYKIKTIVASTNDTTPDTIFNRLLTEITLDPTYMQLDITWIDDKSYLVGGPLSYLFTCKRY